jgi:outer membrane protein assembly factor BamB
MGGVASTPCISDGKVYVGTTNGYLYCLNLANGSQIWARQTTDRSATPGNSRIISSPVVYNGVVYITNEASKVYAYTADSNGTLVAGYPIVLPIDTHGITNVNQQNICGASSPAIATVGSNTYLLVGCDDGYVYRIELCYRSIAALNMGGCVESSPSVSGNYAYIGVSIYGGQDLQRITIEDSTTGDLEHSGFWKLGEESRATASLAYDFAYNGVDTGYIFYRVHDPDTDPPKGYLPQFADADNYFVGSAGHTTGGIVYTGNDNGRFYALDAADLHSLVNQQDGEGYYDTESPGFICSSPAIGYNVDANHNRWVFITTRADGGKLYAFKTTR